MNKGLVHIYTGPGKGKTTACIGLAVRAAGAGLRVCIYQFIKGRPSSELKALKKIGKIRIRLCGGGLIPKGRSNASDVRRARTALARARGEILSKKYDMVILDEVNVAMSLGLIDAKDVLDIIDTKPVSLELVLTGRDADSRIIARADYVTRFTKVKHPFDRGLLARRGIEY